jgi:hypothetical protein
VHRHIVFCVQMLPASFSHHVKYLKKQKSCAKNISSGLTSTLPIYVSKVLENCVRERHLDCILIMNKSCMQFDLALKQQTAQNRKHSQYALKIVHNMFFTYQ